jgi:diamine N-acetyltransferase
MITGRVVNLRQITMSDLPKVIEWCQDQELMKYYDELCINSPHEIEHLLHQNITAEDRIDYIIETKNNETVGRIFLKKINLLDRNLEIHTMVGQKSKRNLIFGAEAAFLMLLNSFHTLGMHKVYGRVMGYSKEMIKLLNEIGFTKEAVCKKRCFQNGKYHDVLIFGLLDREFEQFIKSSRGQKYFKASQGSYDV